MDIVFKSVMWLTVLFADPEGDGSFNYLLDQKHSATSRQFTIAHSYQSNIGWKPGDQFEAEVEMICAPALTLDPVPKALEYIMPWGVPRDVYICNADLVTVAGKEYKSLIRGSK